MTIPKQIPIILLGSLFALLIFGFVSVALAAPQTARTTLSGSNEVPPNSGSTTGSISLTYDSASTSTASSTLSASNMQFSLDANGNDITMAHLHCGAAGVNGPAIVTLYASPTTTTGGDEEATSTASSTMQGVQSSGLLASNSITDDKIQTADCTTQNGSNITTVNDLAKAIAAGNIYVNIHTIGFPDGAARGQLAVTTTSTGTSTGTTTPPTSTSTPPVSTTTPPVATTTPPVATTTPPTATTTPPVATTTPPVATTTPTTTPPVVTPPGPTEQQLQLLRDLRALLAQIIALINGINVPGGGYNNGPGRPGYPGNFPNYPGNYNGDYNGNNNNYNGR